MARKEEVQFQNNYYYNFNNNYSCPADKQKDECSRQSRTSRTVEIQVSPDVFKEEEKESKGTKKRVRKKRRKRVQKEQQHPMYAGANGEFPQ